MLQCGKNFKGSNTILCEECNVYDDEDHGINFCRKYRTMNNFDCTDKVNFNQIFSEDIETLRSTIQNISKVWNVKNANGTMHVE